MSITVRLQELGITLPPPPKAVAAYVPAVVSGRLCFTSGQLPFADGRLLAEGRVGGEVTPEDAYQAARQAALNALSVAAQAAGGVDRLKRVVKVVGFVQSTDDFHGQPQVINGASELFESVFGEAGRHARSAVGTNALPLNAAVEVECIFEIGD
ncbi:endoribonuclease l-psp [Sulfobacillus acidophilus TPY]|uniref:Endoribonuclease L-PSP n=1 Tax=Sulfobacillus acidophilus (strain ATCC 700253 / DSM 10332 / NAL) TaxID=679936 RepID=G8TZL7_SULAD|nr:endoribonuclease l-psp [Sulfobacillus acidophilus TPY]AEW05257.1 Endoribonuclease L-PSP [Sulfobacillus acidophilus DSM 10332]